MFRSPLGGERAFDGGFQQRLAVLRELLLRGLEFGYAGIEVGEQFFEFGDDAGLFGTGSHGYMNAVQIVPAQTGDSG